MKLLALFIAIVGVLLVLPSTSIAQIVSCQVETRQTDLMGRTYRISVPVDLSFCIGTPTPTFTPVVVLTPTATLTATPSHTPTVTLTPTVGGPTATVMPTVTPVNTNTPNPSGVIRIV